MPKTEWPEDIRELHDDIYRTAELVVDVLIEYDIPLTIGIAALAWIISAAIKTMPAEIAREKVTLIKELLEQSLATN